MIKTWFQQSDCDRSYFKEKWDFASLERFVNRTGNKLTESEQADCRWPMGPREDVNRVLEIMVGAILLKLETGKLAGGKGGKSTLEVKEFFY